MRRAQLDLDPAALGRGRRLGQPVDLGEAHGIAGERRARADHDPVRVGLQADHVERRLRTAQPQAAALADGVVDDAVVAAGHAAVRIDDLAGLGGARAQGLHDPGVGAVRHEADVLAVRLGGHGEAQAPGQRAGLGLGPSAQGKAQELELLSRGREQEIALVAAGIGGAVQLGPVSARDPAHVVAGGQRLGAQVLGGGQQVAELDPLVAAHAGDRGLAPEVGLGEVLHHAGLEAVLVVEHVMGDAEPVGHAPRVVDVLAGAARALAPRRGAVVVELQRDADDVVAFGGQQRRGYRTVHAARHGDHDPGLLRRLVEPQSIHGRIHRPEYRPRRAPRKPRRHARAWPRGGRPSICRTSGRRPRYTRLRYQG